MRKKMEELPKCAKSRRIYPPKLRPHQTWRVVSDFSAQRDIRLGRHARSPSPYGRAFRVLHAKPEGPVFREQNRKVPLVKRPSFRQY
jgi:hypothetical protein